VWVNEMIKYSNYKLISLANKLEKKYDLKKEAFLPALAIGPLATVLATAVGQMALWHAVSVGIGSISEKVNGASVDLEKNCDSLMEYYPKIVSAIIEQKNDPENAKIISIIESDLKKIQSMPSSLKELKATLPQIYAVTNNISKTLDLKNNITVQKATSSTQKSQEAINNLLVKMQIKLRELSEFATIIGNRFKPSMTDKLMGMIPFIKDDSTFVLNTIASLTNNVNGFYSILESQKESTDKMLGAIKDGLATLSDKDSITEQTVTQPSAEDGSKEKANVGGQIKQKKYLSVPRQVQEKLNSINLGIDPLSIDGKLGPLTMRALQLYCLKYGLDQNALTTEDGMKNLFRTIMRGEVS